MSLYKNKYRVESARLKGWDYSSNGYYFLTICTKNRKHYFGEIVDSKMDLNAIGILTENFWKKIPEYSPYVSLDAFVIMPNHMHGILVIDEPHVETPKLGVSTNKHWKSGTIGVIINQFKRICTINARKINPDFAWQPRFYDHIIRDEESLENIQNYIHKNPQMWYRDRNNKIGIKM